MIPTRRAFSRLVADTSMRNRFTLGIGVLGLMTHTTHAYAASSDSDVQQLTRLVKMQAQQIHELQSRLSNVEKRTVHIAAATNANAAAQQSTRKPFVRSPALYPRESVARVTPPLKSGPVEDIKFAGDTTPTQNPLFIDTGHTSYPLTAAAPGSFGAISNMPSGSAPVMGVASQIPTSNRTTTVGGLVLKWGKGLPEITTPDNAYSFRMRGRILADYGSGFGARFPAQNVSRTALRAARLGVEGNAHQLSWVLEGDYSGNELSVMSAFMTWSDKMAGHLVEYTLGNKFNERSFDGSTGSDQTVFLDRDIVANALLPVKGWYGLGGAFKIFGDNWHVATQISGNDVNTANVTNNVRDDMTYMLRTHYIPWRSKKALIHLGAWGFYEDVKPSASFTQRIRLLARTDDAFNLQFGPMVPLANSMAGGVEVFGIWGPAWALAEYGARHMKLRDTVPGLTVSSANLGAQGTEQAFSFQTGAFLTGETPNYFAHTGQWATPRILHPLTEGGYGGWEVAARWDWIDATSIPTGGRAWTATIGVNWYLLSFARLMFNYTHADVTNKTGNYIGPNSGNIVGMRSAVTF
ncbi:OprO/OprP family phosphate-selective porin [Acetobacter indonesiensis]|uniref:OprO/OprP family phosphate-selective porin n=2 Tax=Acetobacter indonesiensis TaxID=104101 RepID=UPI0039E91E39